MQDLHYSFTRDCGIRSRAISMLIKNRFRVVRSLYPQFGEVKDEMEIADIYYLFVRCKDVRSLQVKLSSSITFA